MVSSPKYSSQPSAAEVAAQQEAAKAKAEETARISYERQARATGLRGMRSLLSGASGGGTGAFGSGSLEMTSSAAVGQNAQTDPYTAWRQRLAQGQSTIMGVFNNLGGG